MSATAADAAESATDDDSERASGDAVDATTARVGDGSDPRSDCVEVLNERRTNRWVGLGGATVAAVGMAVLVRSAGLLLVAGLGATLLAYARVAAAPPITIAMERRFDPVEPPVGEPVTVEVTVANLGERTIADLRLADGVPAGVAVTDGEARFATALRPGAATSFEYEIDAGHARRSFGPATVTVRDVVGLVERRAGVDPGTDAIVWPTLEPDLALSLLPPAYAPIGPIGTDEGGEGLAFHSVREHRPGDPLRRIDWRRRARTGDLATVEFQRERAASVVLLLDTRPAAAVAPDPEAATAIERSVTAASALVEGIAAAGHRVGLATLGPADHWTAPGRGSAHRERLQRRLNDRGGLAGDSPAAELDRETDLDRAVDLDRLLARLDSDVSVVFLSPLVDEDAGRVPRRLATHVRSVAVLSPDPTAAGTPGQQLVALERRERLRSLRSLGLDVVDWPADQSLDRRLAGVEGSP